MSKSVAGLLPDHEIRRLAEEGMITPYEPNKVARINAYGNPEYKVVSFGQSSFGYDLTLSPKVARVIKGAILDPKKHDPANWTSHDYSKEGRFLLGPGEAVLGVTREYIKLPRDVTMVVYGKSTYARVNVAMYATPGEAGWEGQLVLEFSNTSSVSSTWMYVNEGIAQALFFRSVPPEKDYADLGGKYQAQKGITHAR